MARAARRALKKKNKKQEKTEQNTTEPHKQNARLRNPGDTHFSNGEVFSRTPEPGLL